MSKRHHTGIHDPDGNFPISTERFHGLLARCQNAHLGRFEGFWSSEAPSVVRLVEREDILDKMTYAFTNPSAADLVEAIEQWRGGTTFDATVSGGNISKTSNRRIGPASSRGACGPRKTTTISGAKPKASVCGGICWVSTLGGALGWDLDGHYLRRRSDLGRSVDIGRTRPALVPNWEIVTLPEFA